MNFTYRTAASTENFINSIGVNTHIDFSNSSYSNLTVVENSILYLGITNLRDSPESSADLGATGLWQQVATTTGAKFDAYIPEGSVANMQASLSDISTLAKQGILNYVEGGNEEDQPYATSQGNRLAITAAFQEQVYAVGQHAGLPVINMSFGVGWSTSSTGDYGTVGNLATYANYANAHTYPGTGNTPLTTLEALNSDAELAANGNSVITTEFGYYTDGRTTDASAVNPTVQAKYLLDGLMDAYSLGDTKTYLYELLDEGGTKGDAEANFGLFTSDGTPKLAATAIHNMTTLLADTGNSFTAGELGYNLAGTISTDHTLLLEKSDGSFWLAIWNEARLSGPTSPTPITVPDHTLVLTLASTASEIEVFDPLNGTSSIQTVANADTVSLSVPDHPILVEIIPAAPAPQDLAVIVPTTVDVAPGALSSVSGVSMGFGEQWNSEPT